MSYESNQRICLLDLAVDEALLDLGLVNRGLHNGNCSYGACVRDNDIPSTYRFSWGMITSW